MHNQLTKIYLDQSKDLVWMVDLKLQLIYANKSYFSFMKKMTGTEKKLNQSALIEAFGQLDMKNWQAYYDRALKGAHFEVEEHFYNKSSHKIQYNQITFEPLIGEDKNIFGVSCRSKDITRVVQKQSEASHLLNASLDVFCSVNAQGDFLSVSDSALRLWGYTPEELIGQNFRTFVLENDLSKTNKKTESIIKGEEVTSFYNRFRKKDGGIAYNLWSATWDDSTQLMYAVSRDVKEKIKQEEEILQSEQRFKALVQEGSDMIVIVDAQGNYSYASPTNASILGIPQEEFMGRNAFDHIHPDDTEKVLKGLQRVQTENKIALAPFRFLNNKKEWRWLDTVLTDMTDNPAIKGIVANSRDITDHIQEKQRLKLLESVITNTKDAVIITEAEPIDITGPKIIYVNEAFTAMTGYEAEEVVGKTPRILQGPNSNREDLAVLGRALRNWESHELTILNYKKNGEEFWINFAVSPVADENGSYTHWIAIERDVTEQKVKEIENDLISNINDIFYENSSNDITECLRTLSQHITEYGDFDFAEIWLPGMDTKSINRVTNYYKSTSGKSFYEQTKDYNSCELGTGMPGYVWKHKKLEIWKHKEEEEEWLTARKIASDKAGIKVMMGVPLKDKEKVIGVLVLGTEKPTPNLSFYRQLLQKLEKTIGLELSRKKIEIELAQIFNFSPDILCVAGFDGHLKRINPAGLELLGYSLEEMLSKPILSFIHHQDKSRTKEKQKDLYTGRELRNFENRYITKQGSIVWLSWTAVSASEHGIVYSVAKNITEEKKLRELNRQVGILAKIGSWEVDLVNQRVYWSEELHNLHGTDPKTFVPTVENAINFYREDFQSIIRTTFENCILTKEPYEIEAVIVTTDNKEVWVRSTGNAELVDGECTRVYGGFQDINERKKYELMLESLADNLPGVVFQYVIYPDGTDAVKYVSKGSQEVWGYAPEEVLSNIQLIWSGVLAGGGMEELKNSIEHSIVTKSKWNAGYKYLSPKGLLKTLMGYGSPTFYADGTILFNSIILDISKQANNELLLEQTTKVARIGSWEINLINSNKDSMFWSPMFRELLEVDKNFKSTLSGAIEFHFGESKDRIQKAIDLLISDGIEFDEEVLLLTAQGNQRWMRCIGKSEVHNQKRTKIYGSYQDIHERKLAALKLEKSLKSLEDYKFSLDQSAIIAFTDRKGVITSVNDNFCEVSKYPREEIIGKTHSLINSKHHPKEFFIDLWKTIASGNVWRGEVKNKTKTGSYYWVDTTIVPFLGKKGKPVQYLAIRFEITERKKAEEEKYSLQRTLENSLNEIYTFDPETYLFSYANKGALLNLGYSLNEIKEITPVHIKPKFTKSSFKEHVRPLVNNEKDKIIFFTTHRRKNGTEYPVEVHLQLVNEANKKRFLAIVQDISEQKKMTIKLNKLNKELKRHTLELERSNEELEQFAFIASHDLQEPLRMISSFMDLLKRKYGNRLDEKGHQYIHFATDGAIRMKQIILDLLEYSRTNRPTEGKENVNLNEILSEFKQLRRQLISDKKASINSDNLPILTTYKAAITQIFHCLLDNALKYSQDGRPPIIEVLAIEKDNEWIFSIQDNGIGIAPEFYDKIFVMFQRLHNNDQYVGTGIGLAIAKRHVELLQGKIWLESQQGNGSVFHFKIPKINEYE